MKISNAVDRDFKVFRQNVNAMFAFNKFEISKSLKEFQSNVIKIIAYHLSSLPKISWNQYMATRMDLTIMREIDHMSRMSATHVQPQTHDLSRKLNLMGRLFVGFVARKSQPPWVPVKLDLHSKIDPSPDNALYYIKKLEALILTQLHTGVRAEESLDAILKRIRKLFSDNPRVKEEFHRPIKEGEGFPNYDDPQITQTLFNKPMVETTEGFFSLEDIENLQEEQRAAMGWANREYRPDNEAIWARNQAFMAMEQDLMRDAVTRLHDGMLQIGDENMGIKDFKWVVSFPQKECDSCTDRDGLLMSEIKDRFGTGRIGDDGWPPELRKDSPPPLHPNCRCQLVPAINDDWSDNAVQKDGWEWNQETGAMFNPTSSQSELGFTKMGWDDWMTTVRGNGS